MSNEIEETKKKLKRKRKTTKKKTIVNLEIYYLIQMIIFLL